MKVVVQDVSSKLYVGAPQNHWVKIESEARDFCSSLSAIDYCVEHRIFGVEIILAFDDPRFNIRLDAFSHRQPHKRPNDERAPT